MGSRCCRASNDRRAGPPDQPGKSNQEITRRPTLERLGGEHTRVFRGRRLGSQPVHVPWDLF
jgi:hypothetical protein